MFGIEIGIYLFYLTMSLAVTTQPSWFWCQEPDPLEVERRDWNQQTRRQCGTIAACSFIFFSINSSVASPVWLNCVREHLWWVTSIETVSLCFLFSTTLLVFGFKLCDLISFVVAHLSRPILLIMDLRLSVTAVSHRPNLDFVRSSVAHANDSITSRLARQVGRKKPGETSIDGEKRF